MAPAGQSRGGMWLKLSRDHPFTLAGLVGLVAFGCLIASGAAIDRPAGALLLVTFRIFGAGFHLSANTLAQLLPTIPGWLDAVIVVVLGFAPYAALDAGIRRLTRAPLAKPPAATQV
jgi:hypothetical protein